MVPLFPKWLRSAFIVLFLGYLFAGAMPVSAATKGRTAPFDGVERNRVIDGRYGNESLVLRADSSFRWKYADGDSRWDRQGIWVLSGDGSSQLRLQYHHL